MNPILSIIVPVYKVEDYLRKCIDSLLKQNLSENEYEIILVDDGSPDNCPAICEEYAAKYHIIRVIHQANAGLGGARNTGIKAAKGEFIQFVDSDDYLEPNVLKALVNKMIIDNLDVLRFNYQNVNEKYEVFEPNKVSKPFVDYRDGICDGLTFLTERLGTACYAPQFIISRSLLNDCFFKEGIYFEDVEWTPRLLIKAQRVSSTIIMVYNYLVRQGSITKSSELDKKKKELEDRYSLIDAMQEQMTNVEEDQWFKGIIAQITIGIIGSISKDFYRNRGVLIHRLIKQNVFPLSSFHATPSATRKIRIANVSPLLLCCILHYRCL